MCSIGGWISTTPLHRYTGLNLARALLFYGRGRGMQSGGVYYDGRLLKRAMDPQDVMDMPEFGDIFEQGTSNICLTHTRQPTCGGRGDEQAQPFSHGDATTVHNGWYFDTDDIKRSFGIKKPSGVDSELACRFISAHGPLDLPRFIEGSSGASAIACKWKDELYLMRSGNPICYMHIPLNGGEKITVFASTADQLANAVHYVWLMDDEDMHIRDIKEGILYRANPGKLERLTKTVAQHDEMDWRGYGGYGTHCGYSRNFHAMNDDDWKAWSADDNTTDTLSDIADRAALCKEWLDEDEFKMYLDSESEEEAALWVNTAEDRRDSALEYELEVEDDTSNDLPNLDKRDLE